MLPIRRCCATEMCKQNSCAIAFPEEVRSAGGVCRREVMSDGEENFAPTM